MNLKILSWNARSIKGKIPELSNHLEFNFYHLILIQETWLNPKISVNLPNYTCVRNDRESNSRYPHGGVLIFVHSSVHFNVVNFANLTNIEAVFIRIPFSARELVIGSIYCSSSLKASEKQADYQNLLSRPGPFVLAGDFNVKHSSWNNSKNDRCGSFLRKFCDENLCKIHFTDEPTNYPIVGSPSFLDFAVSKGVSGVSKPSVINDLSSDHLPIVFDIPVHVPLPVELKVRNFAKADWRKFRQSISSSMDRLTKSPSFSLAAANDIDSSVEAFNSIVNDSSKLSIPMKKPFIFRYAHSQDIQNLKSKRNFLRKHSRRYPMLKPEVNELNRQIKRETAMLNQQSWNNKLASLKTDDLSLYQFTKSLQKKFTPLPPIKSLDRNELVYADKEKSDLIADSFLKSHLISNSPTCHSQAVEESLQSIHSSAINFPEAEKTSLAEVKSLISCLNVKKASGSDEISNRVLKNLPDSALLLLVEIFNACLRIGYFPSAWKVGKVIPIAKPGKDPSLPSSYRPITLLPVIGKIFEKILLARLLEFENENPSLKSQQFGFRAHHSTTQQIMRITETISLRFNENKSTALTLLDIEKAFDAVWHDALLHKIKSLNFPMHLIKIVSSFLEDRVSFVSVNKGISARFPIPAGVPQGSPLSPFLFNLYINDIPIPRHCKIAIFADDTALYSSIANYDLPGLVMRMESGLAEIEKHFSSWKIKLNSAKTESILFTHSKIMRDKMPANKIKLNNTVLEWLPVVKYLGVLLDSKLLMKNNIENNVTKARKATGALYPLLKKNSCVPIESKITLYRSYIRPILTYACPVFSNAAKTHIEKIQVAQNKNLRMVLSAPYRTRISLLHKDSKVPTIKEFISKLTERFYKQSAISENNLVKRLGVYSTRLPRTRLKHKLPRSSF